MAATTTTLQIPTRTPDLHRMFQFTDLGNNNNKFWIINAWKDAPNTDRCIYQTLYGRVGSKEQASVKEGSWREVESLIREKTKKGYEEIELHKPDLAVISADTSVKLPKSITRLVDMVFRSAGESIKDFLSTEVDALSEDQVETGRKILGDLDREYRHYLRVGGQIPQILVDLTQAYYKKIPTQLPSRINIEQTIKTLCETLDLQEDRLSQLSAALATIQAAKGVPGLSLYDLLGAQIEEISTGCQEYEDVQRQFIETSRGARIQVHNIFGVHIPTERFSFQKNDFGSKQILSLIHGTRFQYVRHILKTGLIVPKVAANGRMFGDGLYFANESHKSLNYVQGYENMKIMFLADVAVGDVYTATESMNSLKAAPNGFHSVLGKKGHTKSWGGKLAHDEYIVYRQDQQTIRYILLYSD